MLFKQWDDIAVQLDPIDDDEIPIPVTPTVSTNFQARELDHILVIQSNMSSVINKYELQCVGSIEVEYPEPEIEESDNDFDEDQQLYLPKRIQAHHANVSIPVHTFSSPQAVIEIPVLASEIAEKVVANEVAKLVRSCNARMVMLAPCHGIDTPHKLNLPNSEFSGVPNLEPPHHITGTCAALLSSLNGYWDKCSVLVLEAEGPRDFETINPYALIQASEYVHCIFKASWKKDPLLSRGFSSGMYI